jgi:hypothetical protein
MTNINLRAYCLSFDRSLPRLNFLRATDWGAPTVIRRPGALSPLTTSTAGVGRQTTPGSCPENGQESPIELPVFWGNRGRIEKQMENAQQNLAWLTASEAAQYLKVEPRTLMLWARQGKVKGFTLSGTRRHVWRFQRGDLDAMLTSPSVATNGRIQ